jgi:hypothetical protein
VRYRIENVSIPETRGIANPGTVNDGNRDLPGRRIIAVLEAKPAASTGDAILRVLTEEIE